MLVNCSKNEDPETIVNDNLVSIKATNNFATPMTKTSIGTDDAESTRLINWSTGDQIGVICSESGATNEALTLSSSADLNTGTFTGNLTWSETPDELHNFYAYYPYSSSDVTDGVLSGSVPSSQTQVGNDNSDNIGQYIYTVASKT
ncbi:MAG: fimbrillin family protein, partial [Bacteroidales bacterium]